MVYLIFRTNQQILSELFSQKAFEHLNIAAFITESYFSQHKKTLKVFKLCVMPFPNLCYYTQIISPPSNSSDGSTALQKVPTWC